MNSNRAVLNTSLLVLGIFSVLFFIQAAHMLEHVAQVVQKFMLHWKRAPGILGDVFDFEWVHFVYNVGLWIGLFVIYRWLRRVDPKAIPGMMTALVWFQGYHSIEHVAKMYQYYAYGITVGPKGILGFVFPIIWLHFFFNLIVLVMMVVTLFQLRKAFRREMGPSPTPAMA